MRSIINVAFVSVVLGPAISAMAADNKDYSKTVEVSTDVVYGHKFGLAMTMDVLRPKKDANGAGIVWIVSGGWHSGHFPPHAAFSSTYPYAGFFDCRALLDKGFAVFFVRHGDGSRFTMPEIVDDVRRSVRFIRINAKKFGVAPDRLGALGGSAGGHLAMMLATTADEGVPNPTGGDWMLRYSDRVAAVVAYFPPTDIRSWFENGNAKHYEKAFHFDPKLAGKYSPLLWVTSRSAPALLIHGDKDTGVPIWHSEKMLAEYKKNNVLCKLLTIKGVGHGFDIGFKGFAQYTPEQMKIATQARDTTVAWFEKILLAPRKEAKTAEEITPASAPKVNLSRDYAVVDLSAGPAGPWAVTELDKAPEDLLKNDAWRTTKILLRRIAAGTFKMGSPPEEAGRAAYMSGSCSPCSAETQHTVTLTRPYYIGVFPVTQKQWSLVMGSDPSWFSGNPKRPVENVSWNEIRGGTWPGGVPDASRFIGKLCVGSSQPFDLPTEAQWEYACRAGTIRAFNDQTKNKGEGADCTDANLDPLGWYESNSGRRTHDVGEKQANAWGLYDMHGNVSQWCLDLLGNYSGDATDPVGPATGSRVIRGGYWSYDAIGCRSAARNFEAVGPGDRDTTRYNVLGFRLVLNSPSRSRAKPDAGASPADTPPMGWNTSGSYNLAGENEDMIKRGVDAMVEKGLKAAGYGYVLIDYGWYQKESSTKTGANGVDRCDAYGRLVPYLKRFPSATDGRGFKPLAGYIHGKGMKLGLHIMRGIYRGAYDANLPVKGTTFRAREITDKGSVCGWSDLTYGLNMSHPGAQAYLDSLLELYGAWGVDFLKIDDLISPYHEAEVEGYRKATVHAGRPIVISGSPGDNTPLGLAAHLRANMEMFRVTKDQWDRWSDILVQFERARQWAPYCGQGHWADLDALPFGKFFDQVTAHKAIQTRLSQDEIRTDMTLHCIARSPLVFYADPTCMDDFTREILTNPDALDADRNGSAQRQFAGDAGVRRWISVKAGTATRYLALFNLTDKPLAVEQPLADVGFPDGCEIRDIWSRRKMGFVAKTYATTIAGHGVGFYRLDAKRR